MRMMFFFNAFVVLFCIACNKEQPTSYAVSLQESISITGDIWKEGTVVYTDLYVTDQYFIFSEYENNTTLQIFDKKNPTHYIGFKVTNERGNINFVKSNTRYVSEKDDIWIVENNRILEQLRFRGDSISSVNRFLLPMNMTRSTNYNFTKDEMYGVPIRGSFSKTFYFFHPDSGYYWVGMYGIKDKLQYKDNPYAFLSNICVNEKRNAVACAFLFFNQVQFFDLRGRLIRSVIIGDEDVMPLNYIDGSLDYENSTKCIIDICATDRYVYCLYDGSKSFNNTSLIFVFNWDGEYVKTYNVDRKLKKIAVDESNMMLVSLASNDQNGRDVVCYSIK